MQKITPFLWFDGHVQEATNYYLSVFKMANIVEQNNMSVTINIFGQNLILFNGGPMYKLNESFSLMVSCNDQAEIDYYWDKLVGDGGEQSMCGWCKDKFGLSWQIIPKDLEKYIANPKGMQAMLKMNKIIIKDLEDTLS